MANETLKIYDEIRDKYRYMPAFKPGECEIEPPHDYNAKELDQHLQAFAFDEGWLCYQSELITVAKGETVLSWNEEQGQLLYGELVGKSSSLHIRQTPEGQWRLAIISEKQGINSCGLSQDTSFLAIPRNDNKGILNRLNYRIYHIKDENGYRQYASRFLGFHRGEA